MDTSRQLPFIPETITVHLGPPNSPAQNITVSFPEYIKNVASSEIYPTWPEEAIRANIYAQISFALNRVYNEYYRSQGYDFDITNSTAIDQSFVNGRDIFENISQIVDEIFDSYITRQGNVEPLFAQYCNGTTVTCPGLSQWGTVSLAGEGRTPYGILQYYYGENININNNTPIMGFDESVPPRPLQIGSTGDDVRTLQLRLNRISANYPAIPKINPVNGVFNQATEDAVREFQRVFNLTQDGIVGRATWYRVLYIYNGVKRLNEIISEGISLEDVTKQYPGVLREGDSGTGVFTIQYFLALIGAYNSAIPPVEINGIFDTATRNAVEAFQIEEGLDADGIVGEQTYGRLFDVYTGILSSIPESYFTGARPFSGTVLSRGSEGNDVLLLQQYLNRISDTYTDIPKVTEDGIFGVGTEAAVRAFQEEFGLNNSGIVGAETWNKIAEIYNDISTGSLVGEGQYAGYDLE